MEHRLLKLELVLAARDAGWHAELEVPAADGKWRADVLATSPNGSQRMAWEAQLSLITTDDIRKRTERFAADDVAVCWVDTHRRPWLGEVPSIRVRPPSGVVGSRWQIIEGLARFAVEPCEDDRVCPGDGHGIWSETQAPLREFVAWALDQRVVPHQLPRWTYLADKAWAQIWTAPQYVAAADEFARAAGRDQWLSSPRATVRVITSTQADTKSFARHVARAMTGTQPAPRHAPMRRAPRATRGSDILAGSLPEVGPDASRSQLYDAVTVWVRARTGSTPQMRHSSGIAGGTPVYLNSKPYGVLRADPEQMDWQRWKDLKELVVFTASRDERNRIAANAPNGVRIVVLTQPAEA